MIPFHPHIIAIEFPSSHLIFVTPPPPAVIIIELLYRRLYILLSYHSRCILETIHTSLIIR